MKRMDRILLGAGCFILIVISWFIALTSKPLAVKQQYLIDKAAKLTADGIYIRAIPLLEEAAGYNAANTQKAENALKEAYLKLMGNGAFRYEYVSLLEKQMNRRDASPDVFEEAALYYLDIRRIQDALDVLKDGIAKTGSADLTRIYEENRYGYRMSRTSYDDVTTPFESTIQVCEQGLWGIAESDGILMIPCEYEQISTFSGDRAIAAKNGEIIAVDRDNFRIEKLKLKASAFGNYANDRLPLCIGGVYVRVTGGFTAGKMEFENICMYSDGYAAAKISGNWGVVGLGADWLLPAEYDWIIQDELGRCYAQGAVFARKGGDVFLFTGGRQTAGPYEGARPFSSEGYAAVKKNGKWGYINTKGDVVIDFQFDDALSFGQHLAAVELDGLWGYAGLSGDIVIAPLFIKAKSFSDGSAAVLTDRGWQFITLLEYVRRTGL